MNLPKIDLANWLTAIGTVAVAVLAIWGEWVKARITGPRLILVPHNLQGELTRAHVRRPLVGGGHAFEEIPVFYFHLRVVNRRAWAVAHKVKVLLVGISRRGQDGNFRQEPISVRPQLTWAPAEFSEITPTITRDHILDLGCLAQTGFALTTYVTPNNFNGTVRANETVRIELQVEADNFYSDRRYIYEISWDGIWTTSAEELSQHITVREVTDAMNSMTAKGDRATTLAGNGQNKETNPRLQRLPRPFQGIWRVLYAIEGAFLWALSMLAQTVALVFSPFLLAGLVLCLGLLAWNHRALLAPSWIATSISIVCGGVISLLAMGKPIRKDGYIIGIALLFMFIPAALGCWAALQPQTLPSEKLSFVTILEGPGTTTSLEIDPAWEREYPYMSMMRTIVNEELSEPKNEASKQASEDAQFNKRIELVSSMDLVELLLFQQMRWRFERDWDVKVDKSKIFGMEQVSIGSSSGIPTKRKQVLTRELLQQALPLNKFLDQLPGSYQVVLPEGMTITTEPIEGWPNHALVFEDAYCQIRFKPESKSLTRGFWLSDDQRRQPFISHLRVGIEVTFKGFRVGTSGTAKRREWIQALLQQMKEPRQAILSD